MKKLLLLTLAALPFIAATQTVPSYVPTNGLVGWWPFNGNANDESGNGNNGTVNGATLTTDRNGNLNSAFSFNAFNWSWGSGGDYVYIPFNSNYNSSNLTVTAWFNKSANYISNQVNPSVVKRFEFGYSNPNGQTWGIFVNTNGDSLGTFLLPPNTTNNYTTTLSQIGPNVSSLQWHNVTITFDGIQMITYFDGLKISNKSANGMVLNANGNSGISVGISVQANGHWDPFNGLIDDIGIWNRALDSCEIKDLYFASLGNCCNASITTQPVSQNAISGGNAVFTTASSNTSANYQWQSDVGFGFQNLSNAGQYSGVNTATLTISNISALNNNQSFRCLVSSGACSDTSDVVYILNTTGVNESISKNIISISPNPAKDMVSVSWLQANIKVLLLRDASGRVVRTYNVSGKQASLSLEGLEAGVYFLCTSETSQAIQRIVKE